MSSTQTTSKPTTKKFGKGERMVPASSQKAQKYYPAEDERAPKKTRKTARPTHYRSSLQPGTILILLAGRFRGKRVVLLRPLSDGVLLITGPFKANGVPLRRVNARYVIATSMKVDLAGVDSKVLEKVGQEGYFSRGKREQKKKGAEAFFEGKQPEKKQLASERAEDQKAVDKALLQNIKKADKLLLSYLHSSFSLRNGDRPHEMKF